MKTIDSLDHEQAPKFHSLLFIPSLLLWESGGTKYFFEKLIKLIAIIYKLDTVG